MQTLWQTAISSCESQRQTATTMYHLCGAQYSHLAPTASHRLVSSDVGHSVLGVMGGSALPSCFHAALYACKVYIKRRHAYIRARGLYCTSFFPRVTQNRWDGGRSERKMFKVGSRLFALRLQHHICVLSSFGCGEPRGMRERALRMCAESLAMKKIIYFVRSAPGREKL